jgi:hypothetical protein
LKELMAKPRGPSTPRVTRRINFICSPPYTTSAFGLVDDMYNEPDEAFVRVGAAIRVDPRGAEFMLVSLPEVLQLARMAPAASAAIIER